MDSLWIVTATVRYPDRMETQQVCKPVAWVDAKGLCKWLSDPDFGAKAIGLMPAGAEDIEFAVDRAKGVSADGKATE